MPTPPLLKLLKIKIRRMAVEAAFDDLFSYSQFTEVALIERSAAHQAAAITSDLFYPDRVTDEEIDRLQDEQRQLQESFPQALRVSLLGLAHATFETQLVEISRVVALSREIPFPSKVKTAWSAKTFLEKECGIDCADEGWALFKSYQSIRNAFLHNDGRIDIPLNDGSNVVAAAEKIGADVNDFRISLNRECAANFAPLCRKLCMLVLIRNESSAL